MATCPKCKRDLPEQARECPHCGADTTWWLSRDGKVYGPYDEKTVRYIVRDRRAELDDPAMIGRKGTWRPLRDLLEPPVSQAQEPTTTPQTGAAEQEDPYRHWSIGGWLLFIAIFLVVCVTVAGAIVWPTHRHLSTRDRHARCRAHLKQIYLSLDLYAHENGGRLPPSGEWMSTIESFIGSERAHTPAGRAYWLNETLGGKKLTELAEGEEPAILAAEPGALESGRTDTKYLCLQADGTIDVQPAAQIEAATSGNTP